MKKRLIYYIITGAANLIAIVVWFGSINLTLASFVPLAMFLLLCVTWIANVVKTARENKWRNVKYNGELGGFVDDSNLSKADPLKDLAAELLDMLLALPILFPFVFFFSDEVKGIGSLIVTVVFMVWFVWHMIKPDIERKKAERLLQQKELREEREREETGYKNERK